MKYMRRSTGSLVGRHPVGAADVVQDLPGLVHQRVRAGGAQLVCAAEAPDRAQRRQSGVVAGGDVHVAVADKEGGFGVGAEIGQQAVDAGGGRLDRHAGAAAPDQRKGAGGEIVVDDAAAEGVRLVGKTAVRMPSALRAASSSGMPG